MLTGLASAPVYRLRPSTSVDSVGDEVTSWESPTRAAIPRAQFDDRHGTRAADNSGDRVASDAWLYIVGRYDITVADRVEYRGQIWRIDGHPVVHVSLATGPLVEARLKRIETTR